jgi:HK97 family phage major capsid protein
MTLAELRAAREKAGADVQRLAAESQADGFTATAEWDAGWAKANDTYNAAVAAEEAAIAANDRAAAAARIAADAARLNAAGHRQFRPDYGTAPASPDAQRVAARPRGHGALRAFKGADAARDAERAGMWAAAALYGSQDAARWCADRGIEIRRGSLDDGPAATLGTTDNRAGGYFVPNEVDYAVHELALVYGAFRQFAEVVPMSSGTRDTPRWAGGMVAYWTAEGAKPTATDPAWDLIGLVAKELKAMSKMTRVLDEDSVVDLGDKVTMAIAEAFSLAEDQAGFNGDGTSGFGGIVGLIPKILLQAAAFRQAGAGRNTAQLLTLDDFNAVVAHYPNYPQAQPRWFCHKAFWANAMQRLQLTAGGVTSGEIAAGGQAMFLGYPVTWVNVMPAAPAAAAIGAVFGDLRLSTKLGNRRGRTVEVGFENDDFTKGLMTVLGTQRVAINNHTITDPRSSSNPGPVVGLRLAA